MCALVHSARTSGTPSCQPGRLYTATSATSSPTHSHLNYTAARSLCAGIPLRHTCDPYGSKRPGPALGHGRRRAVGNCHPRLLVYLTDGYCAGRSERGAGGGLLRVFFLLARPPLKPHAAAAAASDEHPSPVASFGRIRPCVRTCVRAMQPEPPQVWIHRDHPIWHTYGNQTTGLILPAAWCSINQPHVHSSLCCAPTLSQNSGSLGRMDG